MTDYVVDITQLSLTPENNVKVTFMIKMYGVSVLEPGRKTPDFDVFTTIKVDDMSHDVELPLKDITKEKIYAKIRSELPRILYSPSSVLFRKISKELVYSRFIISGLEEEKRGDF